jgi:hypothetical protein
MANKINYPQHKRTKVQQAGMEQIVYKLIMNGISYRNVKKELMDNHGYTDCNAEKIYMKVINSFKIKNKQEQEDLRITYLEMYLSLYNDAVANRETVTAKAILDSIVKLQGLITQKVEAKIDQTFEVKF